MFEKVLFGIRMLAEYMREILEKEDEGVGVIEVILILVVLIALVVIFKNQLTTLVNAIFESINSKAGTIY